MLLQSTLIFAAVLSDAATAFAPSALSSRVLTSRSRLDAKCECVDVEAASLGEGKPQVLPGVDLPSPADTPKEIPYPFVETRVKSFITSAVLGTQVAMVGEKKSNKNATVVGKKSLLSSQKITHSVPNPSDYQFFGNGEHAKNLAYLVKTNPFMATALTEREGGGFELRAFSKDDADAEHQDATLFRKIMSCLNGGAGHRVNIRFKSDMSVEEVRVYEENKGKRIEKIKGDDTEEVNKWASSALFNLGFYASCVHANIHVLHYLLTAGLDFSSRDFEAMNQWAAVYATNVPAKYGEVGQLLIRNQPNTLELVASTNVAVSFADTYAILTGSSGFGANGDKIRGILHELLNVWVGNPKDYLKSMMNIPRDKMNSAGILTEFMKHHELVAPYAREVSEALKTTDGAQFKIAEERLRVYFKRCSGINPNIDSLEDWVDLMAVTGIVHGCTLSYSRMFADPDVLRWRDIQSSSFTATDAKLHLSVLGTICGMDDHRHVMTSSTDTVGEEYDDKLQAVLEKYEGKADSLKEKYKNAIMKDPQEFNNYGWILSDFCPDGFDGKQLTITTYI